MTVDSLLQYNLPNQESQAERLALFKQKKLLWIAPTIIPGMTLGMARDIMNLVDHGVTIVAVFGSENDKLFGIMSGTAKEGIAKIYHEALFADMSDEGLAAGNIVASVRSSGVAVDGVFSPYEPAMTLVGQVAVMLGLPSSPVEAYNRARSKHACREALREHNLNTPGSMEVYTKDMLPEVVARLGFPLIAKPACGGGSEGVYMIRTEPELYETFAKLDQELRAEGCDLNWNPGMGKNCITIEQFVEGDEFDVDLVMNDGEAVFMNLVYNWPCFKPYFKESAAHCPVVMDLDTQQLIKDYAAACVKAMGFTIGCFHVEIIYDTLAKNTNKKPQLIEINPRMGGGYAGAYAKLIYGVDLMLNFALVSVGIPINPPRLPPSEPAMFLADLHVTCPFTGTLLDDNFMAPLKAHPDIISYEQYKKPNDTVVGIDTGVPEWLAKFIIRKDTHQQAISMLREIEQQVYSLLNIQTKNGPSSSTTTDTSAQISFYNDQDYNMKLAAASSIEEVYKIELGLAKLNLISNSPFAMKM